MNLRILLLFAFLSFGISLPAQNFNAKLILGAAGSQVSGDELSGFNKGTALFGASISYPLQTTSAVSMQLYYLQKGSRKPSKLDQGDPTTYLMRLNYIESTFSYDFSLSRKVYARMGPSLGYLVSSKEENQDGILGNRSKFSPIDVSVMGSLGVPFAPTWNFEFGYLQSLLPIREHGSGDTYYLNKGQYNSVITFTLVKTFNSKSEKGE
ncbi:MAG: porin family protein [Bacteroidota bacterium]